MVEGPHSLRRELVGSLDHIRKFSISRSLVEFLRLFLGAAACSNNRARSSPSTYVAAKANAVLRCCSSDSEDNPDSREVWSVLKNRTPLCASSSLLLPP